MEITINKLNVPIVHRNKRIYNNDINLTSGGNTSSSGGVTVTGDYLPLVGGTITGDLIVNGTTTLNAVTKVGTAMVVNLNADMLDNKHASDFALAVHNHNFEPTISGGDTYQYWRGDKTWQTLNTFSVTESTNLYFTNARARTSISLTTFGSSGAASYNSSTGQLNIPNYAGGAGGVTSIGVTVPTGLLVSPASITTSGTFAFTYASGYSIPTTAKQSQWDTAFGWGNHSGLYSPLGHNHSGVYSLLGHNHSGVYQPLDGDLTSIAGLAGTTGFLKKTAANTWVLDSSAGGGGDNYEGFYFAINLNTPIIIPSKNTSTAYSGGLKFVAGSGIKLEGSSTPNNEMQVEILNSIGNYSSPLVSNYILTVANNDYNVRSIVLETGTYLVSADVTGYFIGSSATAIIARLRSDSTVYASTAINYIPNAAYNSGHIHAIISSTGKNVTVYLTCRATSANNRIDATINGYAGATKLSYIKLS